MMVPSAPGWVPLTLEVVRADTFPRLVIEDGQVLSITYEKLLEVYFQNPQFGYYFMSLTTQRLLENIARLETTVAQYKKAEQARASGEKVA